MLVMDDAGDKLVTIFTSGDPVTLSLVKSILDDAHIPCVTPGEGLQNLFGAGTIGVGYNAVVGPVEVQVSARDADEARVLLSELPGTVRTEAEGPGEHDHADEQQRLPGDGLAALAGIQNPRRWKILAWLVGFVFVLVLVSQWGTLRSYVERAKRATAGHSNLAMGERLLRRKDYGKAVEYLDRAIRENPRLSTAYLARSDAYAHLGDYDKQIDDLTKVIELEPNNFCALGNRGHARHYQQRFEQALDDYDKAISLDSQNAVIYELRAEVHIALKHHVDALTDANKSIELDRGNGWSHCVRGQAHQALKNHDRALADFDEAVRLSPRDERVYYYRSYFHDWMERYEEALRDADRAVELAPDTVDCVVNRVWANLGALRFDRALEDSKTALKLAPDDPYCLLAVGSTFQAINETTAALEIYDRILKMTTATAELISLTHNRIAWKAYVDGDLPKSRAAYETALRIDPESTDVRYGLALVLARVGDPAGASREVEYLLREKAHRSDTHVCRGEVRRQSGDLAGALDDFREALKRNPRNPDAYGYRGLVRLAEGKAAEAADDFRNCYLLDPYQKPYFERLASQIGSPMAKSP